MPLRCKNCGNKYMTWAEVRVQWGRWLKKGFTEYVAKKNSPLCNKCTTKALRHDIRVFQGKEVDNVI